MANADDTAGQPGNPPGHRALPPVAGFEPPDYARGVVAAKSGRHREAAAAFQNAATSNPDHAPSHANLGAALARLKDYRAAIAALEIAVDLVSTDVNSLTNLARCWLLVGNFRQAAERAEQALMQNPANVSALRIITASCLEIGNGRKALKGAVDLAKLAPSRESHELLIRSLIAAGCFEKAEIEADRYVAKMKQLVEQLEHPTDEAGRYVAQAELLRVQVIRARNHSLKPVGPQLPLVRQRREELLELLLQIVNDTPTGAAWYELGRAHHDLHQHEAAERALRKSVELQPKNADALELLGDVLIERSLNVEAVEMLDRALAINPYQSKALLMRVRTAADESEREKFHRQLDEYLAMPDARPNDRINWNFAKGQLFDKSREYDRAFAHYLEAGRLKEKGQNRPTVNVPASEDLPETEQRPGTDHDDRHRRHYEGSRQVFTQQFFASRPEAASPSRRPIFVVGVPRSGTTLLEQILASHPSVAGAGELPEISSFAARCDELTRSQGGYPDALASVSVDTLASFGQEYLAQLDRVSSTADRVVDKMPGNLIHVGLIHTLFPNAYLEMSVFRPSRTILTILFAILRRPPDSALRAIDSLNSGMKSCLAVCCSWTTKTSSRILSRTFANCWSTASWNGMKAA